MDELSPVEWADEVDADAVLTAARSMPLEPSPAQLDALAALLSEVAGRLDVDRALAAVPHDQPRALLAGALPGPLVVLRWYAPGEVSTVHRHAWTVIVGLHGSGELERWVDGGAEGPTRRRTDIMTIGRSLVIAENEIHRQRSGEHGSFELILIGDHSDARPQVDVLP
jgi:hypothetical protein